MSHCVSNISADINGVEQAKYVYDAWGNHQVYDKNGVDITANMLYNMDINEDDSDEVKSNKLDELAKRSHIGNVNPIRYRGYYFDVESRLYYLNTRYYDPEIGRFINADEITILDETQSQIHGLNLYMYCGNNPVGMIDPSGMFFITSFLIGLGIAAAVGATVGAGAKNTKMIAGKMTGRASQGMKALITTAGKYGSDSRQLISVSNLYKGSINSAMKSISSKAFNRSIGIISSVGILVPIGSYSFNLGWNLLMTKIRR